MLNKKLNEIHRKSLTFTLPNSFTIFSERNMLKLFFMYLMNPYKNFNTFGILFNKSLNVYGIFIVSGLLVCFLNLLLFAAPNIDSRILKAKRSKFTFFHTLDHALHTEVWTVRERKV